MNREELLAAIAECQRAITAAYRDHTRVISQGFPILASDRLNAAHRAEKELGRLRGLLADLDRQENHVEDSSAYGPDSRPWWKKVLQLP